MDLPNIGDLNDRDEITKPIMTREEIKRANSTSQTCVQCGTPTKESAVFKYCPLGCGDKKKRKKLDLDILELESQMGIKGPDDPDGGWQMF